MKIELDFPLTLLPKQVTSEGENKKKTFNFLHVWNEKYSIKRDTMFPVYKIVKVGISYSKSFAIVHQTELGIEDWKTLM